jgi:membrane protease YdiL (CAAX protease family)
MPVNRDLLDRTDPSAAGPAPSRGRRAVAAVEVSLAVAAVAAAVVLSSAVFGLIHTEQGLVGVLLATIDGVFFAWLRLRFASLWASVIGHGTGNTIGMVAFFLVGPVAPLW